MDGDYFEQKIGGGHGKRMNGDSVRFVSGACRTLHICSIYAWSITPTDVLLSMRVRAPIHESQRMMTLLFPSKVVLIQVQVPGA